MALKVEAGGSGIVVLLRGWDRIMCGNRRVIFPREAIAKASIKQRIELEPMVSFRSFGIGTHNGKTRGNQRRVGSMLVTGNVGRQFWAVNAGQDQQRLLYLSLSGSHYGSAVLEIDKPEPVVSQYPQTE